MGGNFGGWPRGGAGQSNASVVGATGIAGSTTGSRYVGATSAGAPTSGTFIVGDFVIDQTGKVWVCTTAGSPGVWTDAANGGTPATPDQARIYRSTNMTLTDAVNTPVTFTSVRFDNNSLADIGGNPTRLTCVTDGLYLITGNVAWDDYTAGAILATWIDHNGLGAIAKVREKTPTGDTGALVQSVTTPWLLTAGEYVELYVRSDGGGGSQQIDAISGSSPEFSMVRVG